MKVTEDIWHEYQSRLAAFIRSKVDEGAVDDLLQEVFVKVHLRIDSLKDDTRLESWLYQITRNAIIDYYRTRPKSEELSDWLESPQLKETDVVKKELASCLEPMIRELPDKYRTAIQLSEIENKTQKEVAEQVGISISGAKSRIQRGRGLLKTMLDDCCVFETNKHNQILSYEEKQKKCGDC
ncbi:MAG: RNA polymerase sigma factor SigZ [Fibrobacterales bacterium]